MTIVILTLKGDSAKLVEPDIETVFDMLPEGDLLRAWVEIRMPLLLIFRQIIRDQIELILRAPHRGARLQFNR